MFTTLSLALLLALQLSLGMGEQSSRQEVKDQDATEQSSTNIRQKTDDRITPLGRRFG